MLGRHVIRAATTMERKVEERRKLLYHLSRLSTLGLSRRTDSPRDLEDLVSLTNCSLPRGRRSNIDNVIIALPEPVHFFSFFLPRHGNDWSCRWLANIYLKTRIFPFVRSRCLFHAPLTRLLSANLALLSTVPSFPTLYSLLSSLSSENKSILPRIHPSGKHNNNSLYPERCFPELLYVIIYLLTISYKYQTRNIP